MKKTIVGSFKKLVESSNNSLYRNYFPGKKNDEKLPDCLIRIDKQIDVIFLRDSIGCIRY